MRCGIYSDNSCHPTTPSCRGTFNFTSITQIIDHYWRCIPQDATITVYQELFSLEQAASAAARSLDERGKVHSHQRRVGRTLLTAFAEHLDTFLPKIRNSKNFDELLEIVQQAWIPGIGELTLYDTAHRIGCFLGYLPDKVYLHSGTRTGAVNLLGKLPRRTYLELNELPAAFRIAGVSASDVENILCIYKGEFLKVKE